VVRCDFAFAHFAAIEASTRALAFAEVFLETQSTSSVFLPAAGPATPANGSGEDVAGAAGAGAAGCSGAAGSACAAAGAGCSAAGGSGVCSGGAGVVCVVVSCAAARQCCCPGSSLSPGAKLSPW
jgi:hypothetical protein